MKTSKAIAAAISSGITGVLMVWPASRDLLGEETIAALGVVLTTFLVWLIPNAE